VSVFVILIDMGVTLVERRLLVWRPVTAGRDLTAFITAIDLIVIRLPRAKRAW
jgi:hypothetical protein